MSASDLVTDLLGGAQRKRTRVRGFAPWNPLPTSLVLLNQVRAVLLEYVSFLPLTVRQIFYRLVGAHEYAKTEQAYARLGEMLNRARRARLVEMDAIRDDGGARSDPPNVWASAEDFLDTVRSNASRLRLDRQDGQPTRLAVLAEAAGMVPQLGRVANEAGVPVISSGGFDSVTEQHAFAAELAAHGRPTEVLHIGDHDPSGAHMCISFMENVQAFTRELGGAVTFTRLAVTPVQIGQLDLPTAPPKSTDRRAFHGETCQAEAIAPNVLAEILRNAIECRVDQRALQRVLRREQRIRRHLLKLVGRQ